MKQIYPIPLKNGDQICIIDPANAFTEAGVEGARKILEESGFKVVISEDMAFKRGTPQERADKLNAVIRNPDNRGIFCLWGGYGTMTLLDKIDYDALRKNRPVFTGFSDITAMHIAITKETGLVTLHSPALYSVKRPTIKEAMELFLDIVREPQIRRELRNFNGENFEVINEGRCEGRITGGNMTLVSRLMGTPYEIDTKGKILFLEEVGEKPYRLHGILYQLKMAGKLDEAAGIVIGALTDCDDNGRPGSGIEMVKGLLGGIRIPVICNVRAGHISDPLTIPMNGSGRIDGERFVIY